MILGITGGTGCGKTTLLNVIRDYGGLVLDCDEIYHQLLESDTSLLAALKKRFPAAFPDGCFAITHSAVRREVERRLEAGPELAAIDAIGLFESGLNRLCDLTVAVTAPRAVRIERLMRRDGISAAYAESRIRAQHNEDWFREHCDFVLENSGTQEEFHKKSIDFLNAQGIISLV